MTQLFTHTAMANQSFGSTIVPSASSLWSTYISFTTSVLLIRTTLDNFFPHRLRNFLYRKVLLLFLSSPSTLTLVIEQNGGIDNNQLYSAAETYLSSKINPDIQRLRVSKNAGEDNMTLHFDRDEKVKDTFEEIDVNWVFVCRASQAMGGHSLGHHHHGMEEASFSSKQECRYFELSFDKKHKEKVLGSYLAYILERSKAIIDAEKEVRLYTYSKYTGSYGNSWDSVVFRHPSTFETLAMDEKQKKYIMDDLDRFVRRKGFYKKVGRAWKRGYLLYGPPGTGKSSLIAAMANYLKFSVYDLQLTNITRDADLRKLLLSTSNKSILVIEDIDCSVDDLHLDRTKRVNELHNRRNDPQLSLSGLLNFIDGLWSSCGDERIIVFTTNYKDKIDSALLRPGRMDMHIHMSYCTPQAFETLAANYLGVSGHRHRHRLLPEIESMLQIVKVTPAEVAEELMKSEDADVSLVEVVNLLKRKRTNAQEVKEGEEDETVENKDEDVDRSSKRQKVVEQFNGTLDLTLSQI